MVRQNKTTSAASLARDLRVGLLGSPYDWGLLDFDAFKRQQVFLTLTSFAGTREANRQDLLISQTTMDRTSSPFGTVIHNEFSVLEWELPASFRSSISPDWLRNVHSLAIESLNEAILRNLRDHDEKYVATESIIARYGTQVMRVGTLLHKPQIHIENEALAYLIESPWRNEHELDYLIAEMVFYLDGDVLRKSYVQKCIYEFGTSIRGVSNSSGVRTLIETFSHDVISEMDFRTASKLFEVQLDPLAVATNERPVVKQRKNAA